MNDIFTLYAIDKIKKKDASDDGLGRGDIEEMMGLALGCIGMSMDDFCRCTPSEFRGVYAEWSELRELERRESWERMRMECLCSLQPYSKKRLSVGDVMRFPWDDGEHGREGEAKKEPSRAEIMERFRRAKAERGM